MNKKLTMLVGVAAVGVAAYMLWKKSQKPKSFMNLKGNVGVIGQTASGQVLFQGPRGILTLPQGATPYISSNGLWMVCVSGECVNLTGSGAVNQQGINQISNIY